MHDLAFVAHIHQVERVNLIACLGVELLVHVAEHEDDARSVALHHGIDARGNTVDVRVLLVVGDQIHTEVVETEVGDGDTTRNVLEIHDLVLHLLELLLAVLKVALLVLVDVVVIASRGHNDGVHAVLDARLEVDVVVQILVRPEVDELDDVVLGTDAVHATKALDDAHRVPVDVIVHQEIAVLKVLTFRDAIRGNEDVDILAAQTRIDLIAVLGDGREAGEDLGKVTANAFDVGLSAARSRDLSNAQPQLAGCELGNMLVEVVCGVGERGEDNDLLVARVDGVLDLLGNELLEAQELVIVLGIDAANHLEQALDGLSIVSDVLLPALPVKITEVELRFATHGEVHEVGILVVEVKTVAKRRCVHLRRSHTLGLEHLNGVEALVHDRKDALEREPERRDRALEALEQVGCHELADTRLATARGEVAVLVLILASRRRQQIM